MTRNLSLSDDILDVVRKISKGNPGAIDVIAQLELVPYVLVMDEMSLRGERVWIAYRDCCGEDIEKLKQLLRNRDAALTDIANGCDRVAAHRLV